MRPPGLAESDFAQIDAVAREQRGVLAAETRRSCCSRNLPGRSSAPQWEIIDYTTTDRRPSGTARELAFRLSKGVAGPVPLANTVGPLEARGAAVSTPGSSFACLGTSLALRSSGMPINA